MKHSQLTYKQIYCIVNVHTNEPSVRYSIWLMIHERQQEDSNVAIA
jgi:hypothetical protein